ncbi:MAG TPA: hypothetical protein VLA49_21890 [Anaerolineales bacterium]|nr:hypothetical protein [Anaerolineales bacterium]
MTNTKTLCFNFHDLVTVEVNTDRSEDLNFFAAEYQHHSTDKYPAGLPSVALRFRRLPDPLHGYTFHQHKLLARWGYRVKLSNELIEFDVIGNRLAVPMIHHMLLHPSLRYLSAQQGVLLLHSGSVSYKGRSLIFTGYGGVGKTTTTSLMLADGGADWSPHGDDYIFIGPGPRSLAYMTRSHLYRDLLRWVPEVADRLTVVERIRLEFFSSIRRWSGDRIKWALRLPMERLWPGRDLEKNAEPAAVIILKRGHSKHRPSLQRLAEDEIPLDELISMNFYEARHFLNLLHKCQAIANLSAWLQSWQEREQTLLQARLQEIPVYRLDLPSKIRSPKSFRTLLVEELRGLLSKGN